MPFERTKLLIWGKTWPEFSKRHIETVCTRGVREDGSVVRLHPMPLRYMAAEKQYSLYTWVEVPIERNNSDPRPETFRAKPHELRVLNHVDTKNNWAARREIMFKDESWQFGSLHELEEARRETQRSIGVVSPGSVEDVVIADRPQRERAE